MLNLHAHIEDAVELWRERLSCSAAGCHGRRPWTRITAGNGSIRLNGRRYCFPRCFENEMRTHLRQVAQNHAPRARPPHRVPLGLLMLARGELGNEQLRLALEAQKQEGGGRIGEHLKKMGFAHELQITNAVGLQWGCPVLHTLPGATAPYLVPLQLLRRFRMATVHFNPANAVLHIAFAGDVEYRILLAIEQMLRCKAEPCITDESALEEWLESQPDMPRGRGQLFENVRTLDEIVRITSSYAAKYCADELRIVRCDEYLWIRAQEGEDDKDAVDLLFRLANAL